MAQTLLQFIAVIAGIALGVGGMVLHEAWLDLQAVRSLGLTNGRLDIAVREFHEEVARTSAMTLYLIAAVTSSIGSPPDQPLSPWRLVGIIAFGIGHVVLAVDSVGAIRSRRRMTGMR